MFGGGGSSTMASRANSRATTPDRISNLSRQMSNDSEPSAKKSLGKKHSALKKYNQFSLSNSCYMKIRDQILPRSWNFKNILLLLKNKYRKKYFCISNDYMNLKQLVQVPDRILPRFNILLFPYRI